LVGGFGIKVKGVIVEISTNCIELIKKYEGFRSKPYLCSAGVATIGYGSTYYKDGRKVSLKDKLISEAEASELLEYIANRDFGSKINILVNVELGQNMFDALVSFAYNVGIGNLKSSTLLKKINVLDFTGAAQEFMKWNKAGGKVLAGLTKRRAEEKALFEKDIKRDSNR
jgi:lysozyme